MSTKCFRCYNYEVHPSGLVDTCHAIRFDSMERHYFLERANGEKSYCKCYKPIKRYATK